MSTQREVTIRKTDEVEEKLEGFNGECFAFDVETRNKKNHALTADWYKLEIFAMSLYDGETSVLVNLYDTDHHEKQRVLQKVFDCIKQKGSKVIAHNIPFDIKALRKYDVSLYNVEWFDTLIAHHLLDERKSHRLKKLAKKYLGVNVTSIKSAYDSDKMTPLFARYTRNDTVWTWDLAQIFLPKLQEEGLDTLFKKVEMPFQRCIVEMEINGVNFNKELAQHYHKKLKDAINNLVLEMCDMLNIGYSMQHTLGDGVIVDADINFRSHAQIRKLLYDYLCLPIKVETDGGNPSTGIEALKQLKGEHDIIEKLIEFREAEQLKTNFFDVLPDLVDGDGRIRPSFFDFTTVTGRLSSREPNMQNQPREGWRGLHPRECFEASPGKKMVAVDYSSQELRVAAQVTGDETMIEIIRQGIDPHLANANIVFDLEIPREKLKESHPEYKKIKKEYYDERQQAKIFTYGILYGATKFRIRNEFGCSLEQAEKYLETYFEKYPLVKKRMDEVEETIKEQGYVSSLYGRRRRFSKREGKYGKYYPPSAFRQGFNFLIQGASADMMRVAMIKILNYANRNPEYGIDLLMTVHDEVVLECYEEYTEEVCQRCEELMASVVTDSFVVELPAEGGVGENYAEAK